MRHRPMPPLCKGRGTTLVVEGLSKALCKAPEAAVQRRCGDHVSGGRVVKAKFACRRAKCVAHAKLNCVQLNVLRTLKGRI